MTKHKAPPTYSIGWPAGFVSAIAPSKTAAVEPDVKRQGRHRKNGGWDRQRLLLEGSKPYVNSGSVAWMHNASEKVKP